MSQILTAALVDFQVLWQEHIQIRDSHQWDFPSVAASCAQDHAAQQASITVHHFRSSDDPQLYQ